MLICVFFFFFIFFISRDCFLFHRPFRFSSTDSQLDSEITKFQNNNQQLLFQQQQQQHLITPISENQEETTTDYNKIDLNLPQSPRNSIAHTNYHSLSARNSVVACPTSVYATSVNPQTGYRYSGYFDESVYSMKNNNSNQHHQHMSIAIPEYHEHLRNDLYETKRQLLHSSINSGSSRKITPYSESTPESTCCCCFYTKKHPKQEVKGFSGYKEQKNRDKVKNRYQCVGTCMAILTVFCLVILILLFVCFMFYVAWYQATKTPSYYEYIDK